MGTIADLYVAVHAATDAMEKEVVAGAQRAGTKGGDVAGDAMGKGMLAKLKAKVFNKGALNEIAGGLGFGGPLGLAVGGLGTLVGALGNAGAAASDLSETESKLTAVFPDQAKEMKAWASNAATSLGMSDKAALEAAGTFGNFLQAMGTTTPVAAEMSKTLIQLATDLGSFNNQDPSDVLAAMQSGLSGETEPMRRFGVDISDAAVQTQLLSDGLVKVGKGFTQAQKIQGRYELIMKQTITAQGDFARTATGTANATRTTAAQQEMLAEKVGVVVNQFQNLTQVLVGTGAGAIVDLIHAVGVAWDGLTGFLNPAIAAQELVPDAVSRATDAIKAQTEAINENKAALTQTAETQDAVNESWDKFAHLPATARQGFGQDALDFLKKNADWAKDAGTSYERVLQFFKRYKESGASVGYTQFALNRALNTTEQLSLQLGKTSETVDREIDARMRRGLIRADAIEQIRIEFHSGGVKWISEAGNIGLSLGEELSQTTSQGFAKGLMPSIHDELTKGTTKDLLSGLNVNAYRAHAQQAAEDGNRTFLTTLGDLAGKARDIYGQLIVASEEGGAEAGSEFTTAIRQGITVNQPAVIGTIKALANAMKNVLHPKQLAAKFLGSGIAKDVAKGVRDNRREVVHAARDTAAAGIAAILDAHATGRGSHGGWHRVGAFVVDLFASGLDKGGVRAALAAAGMSDAAIDKLLTKKNLHKWRIAGRKQGDATATGNKEGAISPEAQAKYTTIGNTIASAIVTAMDRYFGKNPPTVTPVVNRPTGWTNVWGTKPKLGPSPDGSPAAGLRYVPFNGFLASLHKGERVLTRSQARYDDNTTGGGMSGRIDFVVHDPDGGLARSGISAMGLASLLGSQQQLQRRWEG